MNTMKKLAAILAVMVVASTAFTACGGETEPAPESVAEIATEAETEPETEAEAETEDPALAAARALVAAVSNTVWAGMDADYTCYALGFGEDEIYFGADDGSEVRGYWDISMDASHIFIYSDQELTDEVGGFDWSYDEETNTMIINNTVAMAQTDANSIEAVMDELEKMGVAKAVAEGLNGTYWFGTDSSDTGLVLAMADDKMIWASIDSEGNSTVETLYWGMDYDTLTLYGQNYEPVLEMGWNAAEDLSWLSLDIAGETVQMAPTTEDDAAEFIGAAIVVSEVGAAAAVEADEDDAADGEFSLLDVDASMIDTGLYAKDEDGAEYVLSLFKYDGAKYCSLIVVAADGSSDVVCGEYEGSAATDEDDITWSLLDFTDVYTGKAVEIGFAEADGECYILDQEGTAYKAEYLDADDVINYMAAAVVVAEN